MSCVIQFVFGTKLHSMQLQRTAWLMIGWGCQNCPASSDTKPSSVLHMNVVYNIVLHRHECSAVRQVWLEFSHVSC